MDTTTIRRAATVMKILRLAQQPGMDTVAVKLNMEPTHDELFVAKTWALALEQCANSALSVLDIADRINTGVRYDG